MEWTDSLPISKTAPWSFTTDTPFRYQTTDSEGEPVTVTTSLGYLAQECEWLGSSKKNTTAVSGLIDAILGSLAQKDAGEDALTAPELLDAMCRTFGITEEGETPDRGTGSVPGCCTSCICGGMRSITTPTCLPGVWASPSSPR